MMDEKEHTTGDFGLIESDWNLKTKMPTLDEIVYLGLIESDWNLKDKALKNNMYFFIRINRIRLEFKGRALPLL